MFSGLVLGNMVIIFVLTIVFPFQSIVVEVIGNLLGVVDCCESIGFIAIGIYQWWWWLYGFYFGCILGF